MEIKKYKVENNLAVPVNPYPLLTNSNDCTNDKQSNDENWNNYNEFAKANTFHTNAQDGVYDADCFSIPVWQYESKRDNKWYDVPEEWIKTHTPVEKYLSSWYDKTRQFLPLDPIPKMEKQPSIMVTSNDRGFFNDLRVFDGKDNLLKNWTGLATLAFCMYDDNEGYQEWNVTDIPDRDKANGYRVRECYVAVDNPIPKMETTKLPSPESYDNLKRQLNTQAKHKDSIRDYWLSCSESKKKWVEAIKEYFDSEHTEAIQSFDDFKEQFDLD